MSPKKQQEVLEETGNRLSATNDLKNFTLAKFLAEIYKIGESKSNTVSDNLSLRENLSENARQFFLQAEPKQGESNQATVDKLCRAKLRLIASGSVTWENIEAIDCPDHPLLNHHAISRMAVEGGIIDPTTLDDEIRYRKNLGVGLNAVLELLGYFYQTAISTEMARLKNSINTNDKHKKVENWLTAAEKTLTEKNISPHDKFSFYKRFRIQVGDKPKNIKEILEKRRFGDSKTPESYARITKLEDLLNSYECQLRFKIHSEDELVYIEQKLRWEMLSLIKDPSERHEALGAFKTTYSSFEPNQLQSSAFIFKPKTLGELLEKLQEINIKWKDVRTIINSYYQKKGVDRAAYTVESWSLFFVTLTCNVSPLVKRLDKYAAGAHGVDVDRTELVLNEMDKRKIISEIHRHIHSLGYNKKGKELSESGLMAAKLLHLLFGLGKDFDSTDFTEVTDFKAKELLTFLYEISSSKTAQHSAGPELLEDYLGPPARAVNPVSSQQLSTGSNTLSPISCGKTVQQHTESKPSARAFNPVSSQQLPIELNTLSPEILALLPDISSL